MVTAVAAERRGERILEACLQPAGWEFTSTYRRCFPVVGTATVPCSTPNHPAEGSECREKDPEACFVLFQPLAVRQGASTDGLRSRDADPLAPTVPARHTTRGLARTGTTPMRLKFQDPRSRVGTIVRAKCLRRPRQAVSGPHRSPASAAALHSHPSARQAAEGTSLCSRPVLTVENAHAKASRTIFDVFFTRLLRCAPIFSPRRGPGYRQGDGAQVECFHRSFVA